MQGENQFLQDKKKNTLTIIISLFLILIVIFFLLGFHIVTYNGGRITIIPKEHLSFSETIISADTLIDQYNNRDFGERLRDEGVNLYLIRKLEEKGIIETSQKMFLIL